MKTLLLIVHKLFNQIFYLSPKKHVFGVDLSSTVGNKGYLHPGYPIHNLCFLMELVFAIPSTCMYVCYYEAKAQIHAAN